MTESTTSPDTSSSPSADPSAADPWAGREAARRHIIDSLNRGVTVQSAIIAAIRDGIDQTAARQAGESLRGDMVQIQKKRAAGSVGVGVLWMLGAMVVSAVVIFTYAPYAYFISLALLVAGFIRMVTAIFQYMTVDDRVR